MTSESEDDEAARNDLDKISIDRDAEVPIGLQLVWALRARIDDGRLTPGRRLPGLRDLAEAVGVNLNTVRAAYQRLEQEGLIDSHQGSGTFVASRPVPGSSASEIAATAARAALESGVSPREVAAALYVSVSPTSSLDTDDAQRRSRLKGEIEALDRALNELELRHPGALAPPRRRHATSGPRLLSAAQLEGVRTHLLRRLADVQSAVELRAGVDRAATADEPAPRRTSAVKQPAAKQPKPSRPGRPAAAST